MPRAPALLLLVSCGAPEEPGTGPGPTTEPTPAPTTTDDRPWFRPADPFRPELNASLAGCEWLQVSDGSTRLDVHDDEGRHASRRDELTLPDGRSRITEITRTWIGLCATVVATHEEDRVADPPLLRTSTVETTCDEHDLPTTIRSRSTVGLLDGGTPSPGGSSYVAYENTYEGDRLVRRVDFDAEGAPTGYEQTYTWDGERLDAIRGTATFDEATAAAIGPAAEDGVVTDWTWRWGDDGRLLEDRMDEEWPGAATWTHAHAYDGDAWTGWDWTYQPHGADPRVDTITWIYAGRRLPIARHDELADGSSWDVEVTVTCD